MRAKAAAKIVDLMLAHDCVSPAQPRRRRPDRLSAAGDAGETSKLAGREISRDVIAALKRHGLIDGALRAPQPGAPFAYVTTRKFLEVFGLASLRDMPDLEQLKADGLLQSGPGKNNFGNALGFMNAEANDAFGDRDAELDDVEGL